MSQSLQTLPSKRPVQLFEPSKSHYWSITQNLKFTRSVKTLKKQNIWVFNMRQLSHHGKKWYICHQWCWGRNGCLRSGRSHLDKARPSRERTETHRHTVRLTHGVMESFQNWLVWSFTYRLDQHVDSQIKFFTCDEKWEIIFGIRFLYTTVHSVPKYRMSPLIR